LPTIQFSTLKQTFILSIKKANRLIQNTGEKSLFIVTVVKKIYAVFPKFIRLLHSTADITYSNERSGMNKIYSSTYRRLNVTQMH